MKNYFFSAEENRIDFSPPTILLYYLVGLLSSLVFAYIITDKSFDFFAPGDSYSLSYNYLFLSLIEGKQSVPIRYITLEGQYLSDGTAYMYYGIGPAILRALLYPFLDLQQIPVARFIVWSLVIISGFVCQSTFIFLVRNSIIRTTSMATTVLFLGAVSIWFASPLLILSSGASIYHEPIALAFLCTMIFVRSALQLSSPSAHCISLLLVCCITAAVSIHARPHVALALGLGTAGLWCYAIIEVWKNRQTIQQDDLKIQYPGTALKSLTATGVIIALILGSSALIYIWLIVQRGGAVAATASGEATYGFIFFGAESSNSARQIGFSTDGTFNLRRIIPNGVFHAIGGWNLFDVLRNWFGAAYIRREYPVNGYIMLWIPWILLSSITVANAIFNRKIHIKWPGTIAGPPLTVTFLAMAIIFFFIISYGTITLRYKVEIWPIFWILSLLSLPLILTKINNYSSIKKRWIAVLSICLVLSSISFSLINAYEYTRRFNKTKIWDFEECVKNLEQARTTTPLPDALCN